MYKSVLLLNPKLNPLEKLLCLTPTIYIVLTLTSVVPILTSPLITHAFILQNNHLIIWSS